MDTILDRMIDAGTPALIAVASAAIFEPNWHHPGMAWETAPKTVRTANPIARCWRELEVRLAERCGSDGPRLTILRPCATVAPDGEDPWSRLFRGRLALPVAGHNPPIQLLAPEDLAEAVRIVIAHDAAGVFHVAPDGTLLLRSALRRAGVWTLPLPYWLHRLVSLGRPWVSADIDYRRYCWTVSDDRLRQETGYRSARAGVRSAPSADPEPELLEVPASAETASRRADPYGMDRAVIDRFGRTLLRFLHHVYWRVEARGLRHVPPTGPVVLTGIHRGYMPFDAVLMLHLLATRTGRYPRFLIHPGLLKFAFLHDFFMRLGGVIACRQTGDRLLRQGEMLGVLPEGVRGPFRLYRDTYRLDRHWRHDFVRLALRHRAPILPWVTVGSAEAFPILARLDWRWWKRYTEWPFLPVTPMLLPLPIPLPSKWHTLILPPVHVERRYPPEAADDREVVRRISDEVRARLLDAMSDLVARRPSAFYGSVFEKG